MNFNKQDILKRYNSPGNDDRIISNCTLFLKGEHIKGKDGSFQGVAFRDGNIPIFAYIKNDKVLSVFNLQHYEMVDEFLDLIII